MLPPFDLSVPTDERYRSMAPDVAAKYAELAGCSGAIVGVVKEEVEAAVIFMSQGGEDIALAFSTVETEILVHLTCGSQTATVRQPI